MLRIREFEFVRASREKEPSETGIIKDLTRINSDSIVTQTKKGSRSAARKLLNLLRRRSESNRRIKVLQTSALPLGYAAEKRRRAAG